MQVLSSPLSFYTTSILSRLDPSSVCLGWIHCCTLICPLCPHEHEVLCCCHCIFLAVCICFINVTIFGLMPSLASCPRWPCALFEFLMEPHVCVALSRFIFALSRFVFCPSALPDLSLCVLMRCMQCMLGCHLRWRSHLGTSHRNHHFTKFIFYSSALPHLSHCVLMRCMQCMLGRCCHLRWRSQLGPSHRNHHSPQQHGC